MSNEPKKPKELTPDELDGVSGGIVNPGPPNVRPGLHISPVLADPPDPDRIALPPGPCKIG